MNDAPAPSSTAAAPPRSRGRVAAVAVLVVLALALLLAVGAAWYVSLETTRLSEPAPEPDPGLLTARAIDLPGFDARRDAETIEYTSSLDGHAIPATLLRTPADERHGWVVTVHGLGGTRASNAPFAQEFLARGYDVLTYDQRSSGRNTAPENTFGWWERHDLVDSIDHLRDAGLLIEGDELGVWGTSFGGITTALALALPGVPAQLDFVVLDSPVSSAHAMIRDELERTSVPAPGVLIPLGDLATQARLGFSLEEADAPAQLESVGALPPTLVIVGTADTLTPPAMGEEIAAAIGEEAEVWVAEGSGHVTALTDHPAQYGERIDALLARADG